jgi:hypothetical protein
MNELEQAAEEYRVKRLKEVGGSMTVADYVNSDELDSAFEAGAEWMKQQRKLLVVDPPLTLSDAEELV